MAYNSSYTGAQHDTYVTKQQLIDLIYPVGSIYTSVNSTSPATLFGGTWAQITGRFLLACDSTYTAGSTGGEASHTLTVSEMPAHNHTALYDWYGGKNSSDAREWAITMNSTGQDGVGTWPTDSAGANAPHNNMPPYLAVYMWKRIS